jgi:uncharacterized protein YndB with AHSA1/START domain
MPRDTIEREIEIDAPIDIVWSIVTEPAHIAEWFSDSAEIDLRPGGEGTLVWRMKATSREAKVNLRVERLEPPHVFAFRWDYTDGAEPDGTNSPLVEFTLEALGDSTRLRLVESGLENVTRPEEEKARYFSEHTSGWDTHMDRLQRYVAGQRSATARR